MKMWNVSYSFTAVVVAESELEAHKVARQYALDAADDTCGDLDVTVEKEIQTANDFESGWDAECIPYGGPNNARIGEINPALSANGGAA